MYDLPPRRRISLILVKLGPAHCRYPTMTGYPRQIARTSDAAVLHLFPHEVAVAHRQLKSGYRVSVRLYAAVANEPL